MSTLGGIRRVYFFETPRRFIKIGCSKRERHRPLELRETVPGEQGRNIAWVPGALKFEKYLHKLFEAYRVPHRWYRRHGLRAGHEYFYDSPGIRNWIKAAKDPVFLAQERKAAGLHDPAYSEPSAIDVLGHAIIRAALITHNGDQSKTARLLHMQRSRLRRMLNSPPEGAEALINRVGSLLAVSFKQTNCELINVLVKN